MPRKIIGGAFLSLDGVMQAPGGPEEDPTTGFAHGGWLAHAWEDAIDGQVDTLFNRDFALLLGRRTYDIFAAFWPFQPMEDPIAATFAKVDKYVVTGSDMALEWRGSHRLADLDALAALKEEDGPDLVIQGSSTLYPQLLARGLLDRLILMTAPVTIGTGKRLFGDGTPPLTFKPVETRVGPGGAIVATYEPSGKLETGTFETQEPSAQERDRRAKVEAGTW